MQNLKMHRFSADLFNFQFLSTTRREKKTFQKSQNFREHFADVSRLNPIIISS